MKRASLLLSVFALVASGSATYFAFTALTGASLVGTLQTMAQVCAEGLDPRTTTFSCSEVGQAFDAERWAFLQSDTSIRAGLFLALSAITAFSIVAVVALIWRDHRKCSHVSQ
jgi:hypothetical protein